MIKSLYGLAKLTIFSLLFALCVAFALNNSDFVKLNLSPFNYVVEIRLFLLMLVSFILGSVLTVLFGHIQRLLGVFDLKRLYSSGRIRRLENELNRLRSRCDKLKNHSENETKK
jgi:uncharacterized integral membrane protein